MAQLVEPVKRLVEHQRSFKARLLDGAPLATLIGVLVTLGIFLAQCAGDAAEDERAARADLSRISTRLTAVFGDSVQPEDADAATSLSNSVRGNTETQLLLSQFEAIRAEYPELPTSLDLQLAGQGYLVAGEHRKAIELTEASLSGLAPSTEFAFSRHVAGYRVLGTAFFARGDYDSGRAAFEEALRPFGDVTELAVEINGFQSLGTWFEAEGGAGQCEEARTVLERMDQFIDDSNHPTLYQPDQVYGEAMRIVRGSLSRCVPTG